MSNKRRKHEAKLVNHPTHPTPVSTRPKIRGRTKQETKQQILDYADHKCAWCGKLADQTAPRALGAGVKGSVCWNAAWCGSCDPDMRKVSGMGPPSRFARPDPGQSKASS